MPASGTDFQNTGHLATLLPKSQSYSAAVVAGLSCSKSWLRSSF